MALDDLLDALGAVPVNYPPKVRCCGGMLVATYESVARRLCQELISWARQADADCIVTTCPMCQANLELLQDANSGFIFREAPMPILYFTQLVGLALGASAAAVGLHHNLVPLRFEFRPVAEAPSHA